MSNFFEVLNQMPRFDLSLEELETQFIQAQKAYHPDNCINPQEINAFQEKSALINQAYMTLKDPFKRACYYLALQGFSFDDKTPLSSDFLMQQMNIRERLEQASNPALKEAVYKDIQKEITYHYDRLSALLTDTEHKADDLKAAQALLAELRFWINL